MTRTILTNRQWRLIEPFLPGKATDPGRTGADNRSTLEGILWVIRTGAPWRDMPKEFGHWNTVHRRFRRWAELGVFEKVLSTVQVEWDFCRRHGGR